MLKIYGVYRSRATRPIWLAQEAGIEFQHIPVIQAARVADPLAADAPLNTLSPEFLAINPMGSIPSIDDYGFILHESVAVTLYLAKKYGKDLGPLNESEEAQIDQWALFAVTSIETPALNLLLATGETEEAKAKMAEFANVLARPLNRLEKHLAANSYLVGDRFTVADIIVAETFRYAQGYAPLFENRPAFKAWLDKCQAREAFKSMMETRAAEPA